ASVALLVPGAQPTLALPQRRSEALDSLQRALQSKSPKALDEALVEVIREGGASHVKRLVDLAQRIPPSDEATYWALVRGAASFVDKPALEELGKLIVSTQKRPIARDLFYALAGNSTRHVITALGPVVRDANDDLKVLAAKHLATLPASESVDVLIAALEAEEARKNPDPESLVV